VVLEWVPGIAENPTRSAWSKATQQVGGSGRRNPILALGLLSKLPDDT